MSNRSILYWIGTPRHFLIAAGMAVGDVRGSVSHLLLTSNQDYVDGLCTVLDNWSESPFSRTRVIRPSQRGNSLFVNRIRVARAVRRYRRMAMHDNYSEIRAFPGTDISAQAYLYEVKQRSPSTKRVVIEDGGIYYNNQFISSELEDDNYPMWKLLAGRMLYGPAWAAVKRSGLREVIDEIHLIAPKLARRQLASLNLVKLRPDVLWHLSDTDLPSIYLSLFDCDVQELSSIDVAFILSRSDGLLGDPKGYVRAVSSLVDVARRRGLKIALKYHPKERVPDYLGLREEAGVVEIPRELPMELLFLVTADNLRLVLGDTSSALIGAPWILPDCMAVSFVNMVNKQPELVYPEFERFGVRLIDNEHDLDGLLLCA